MQLSVGIEQAVYGRLPDGREVTLFTLLHANGLRVRVTNYGAILVAVEAPDRDGKVADLTLGYDDLAGWLANDCYFGASVGRFGNRIANGRFSLDGEMFTLACNNAPGGIPCALHGGLRGFDKVLWAARISAPNQVEMTYLSKDGEEGYPGNLRTVITYTMTDAGELIWEATATTDAPTVVNLVHHSYWNLSGNPDQPITDHELLLAASQYLPTDAGLIPTGEIAPVAGTPMDFTRTRRVGESIDAPFDALRDGGGYDHCWVLDGEPGMRMAACLKHPESGRVLELLTDQPGIHFYSGNFIGGPQAGKGAVHYAPRSGLCLETEGFPDAPNQPDFPSATLRPGETYRHRLVHRFSID